MSEENIIDILYDVEQEFENEISDVYYKGRLLTKHEMEMILYFINCYKYKVELIIEERRKINND